MSSASAPPSVIATSRFVKLRDLVVDHANWMNPRTVTGLEDDKIAELGRDIKERGIQVPLIVQKILAKHGTTNLVLEGQRRVLAAHEVFDGDTEIPVVDRSTEAIELTPEAADALMLDMLSVATHREGLSSYELSEVASRLRDRGNTLAKIAKAIGRDESWVSKILTARKNADPKLMLRWRKGQITEEQFKELAGIKDPEKQIEAAAEVVKARESGDPAEARMRTKELAAQFKQQTNGHAKPNGKPVKAPVVSGPQATLFEGNKPADKPPAVKVVIKGVVLEEMLSYADKRPPTADYVKGIMDAIRFVTGEIEMSDFLKSWHAYVSRVSGTAKPKKGGKKSKAKARKPAKKAAKKSKK